MHKKFMTAVLVVFLSVSSRAMEGARPHAHEPRLSHGELKALIANAQTPADHERLAAFYRRRALHFMAQSRKHQELAHLYGDRTGSVEDPAYNMDRAARHCHNIAKDYREEAKEAMALAKLHEQMAVEPPDK